MPTQTKAKPDQLLRQVTCSLGLVDGCLLPATLLPEKKNQAHWVDKGDWLALAFQLGAESVFFVGNEPVVVIAVLPEGEDARSFFNKIWCMARPQFLFLASDGILEAYHLNRPPVRSTEELRSEDRLLAMAEVVAEVEERFAAFRRHQLESGKIYGDERFESSALRADRALVHDLKAVRRKLIDEGLPARHAHSLIGRVLFIRYLEDRDILVPGYFEAIARQRSSWSGVLSRKYDEPFVEPDMADVMLFRVLKNKEFAYALFDQLSIDFNGDIFPVTTSEKKEVEARHIDLLRRLLIGDSVDDQSKLFLFAYRFDVVPIELISSIYEEFYTAREGRGNTQSSYYTSPALADFLLSQALSSDVLDQRPRVIDPACGSGIFLVETFRRIVRHRVRKQGRRLRQSELRCILRDQIAGIDLNPEAVPVAAFSLYLAYLHYQYPREINEQRILPNLRWDESRQEFDRNQHFDVLYSGSAFEAIEHANERVRQQFGPTCAHVVVGNPPWGEVKMTDELGRKAWPITAAWCSADKGRTIGDKEQSQAFIHLSLELLDNNGFAALLLSSGVLFKQHENSRRFRKFWLAHCRLKQVVNFAHVRHIYFSDPLRKNSKGTRSSEGIAPFISAILQKASPDPDHRFAYWSAKRTDTIENSRAIVLSTSDMHWLNQSDCLRNEKLWKIFWWGNRRHESLIHALERFPTFGSTLRDGSNGPVSGCGFEEGSKRHDSGWLLDYRELPTRCFTRYGLLGKLRDVPAKVHRRGVREVYEGHRLLLKRGIGATQRVETRLATEKFCFRHSIEGFRLTGFNEWEEKLIVGIFWSSLARYYFWLTAGSWGMWHDEIHLHIAKCLPIRLACDVELRSRIVNVVDRLRAFNVFEEDLIHGAEEELNEAVFDLYLLTEADRNLVRDMCEIGIDFYYRRGESFAIKGIQRPRFFSGLLRDLPDERVDGVEGYLQVFLDIWNSDLEPEGELSWQIIGGGKGMPVVAVIFIVVAVGHQPTPVEETYSWEDVLQRISSASYVPMDRRRTIYSDTFVRAVGEREILIIKRNEQRHWTRSAALEDADATIAQAMNLAELEAGV